MRLGCDLDGVCCVFEAGYAPILTEVSGITFPKLGQEGWPDTWYWERDAGVTKEQESEAWKRINADPNFWYNLPATPGAEDFLVSIKQLEEDGVVEVYFVTSRTGLKVKRQTEYWIEERGFSFPTVLISSKKGEVCQALSLTHYLDDKVENCEAVRDQAPATKGYMLAQPWNREVPGVPRLPSLSSFIDILKQEVS